MEWTRFSLFAVRVRRGWREKYRMWRTALDWTVWVYLLIPALVLAGEAYYRMWVDPPAWMTALPPWAAALPPMLLLSSARLRLFVEEGDKLFLLQREGWIRGLYRWGAVYTFASCMLSSAVLIGIMLVWFVGGMGLGVGDVLLVMLFTSVCATWCAAVRSWIQGRGSGWRNSVAQWFAAALLCAGYAVLTGLALTAAVKAGSASATGSGSTLLLGAGLAAAIGGALVMLNVKFRQRGAFEADVLSERKARLAGADLLLGGIIERRPMIRWSRPLLFRRSRRLFRDGSSAPAAGKVLAESFLKAFVRRLSSWRIWFTFIGASTMAVTVSPPWLSIAAAFVLPVLLGGWLGRAWKQWLDEPFVAQFRWSFADTQQALSIVRRWVLLPGFLWLLIIAAAGWLL